MDWLDKYGGAYEKDDKDWYNRYEDFVVAKSIHHVSRSTVHQTIDTYIKELKSTLETDNILICFGNPTDNFRYKLATILPYKGNRLDYKPYHYKTVTDYLQGNYNYIVTDLPWEDDDVLATYSSTRKNTIICTIDKDLLQVPGIHYHMDKRILFKINEIDGLRNFYRQLYTGDKTDNIPGYLEITGLRKNVKRMNVLLNELSTEEKMYDAVRSEYALGLGAKNLEDLDCILHEVGNLLYLRRGFENEPWQAPL